MEADNSNLNLTKLYRKDFFILSRDLDHSTINKLDNLEFINYYDICKTTHSSFIIVEEKLYSCMKLNHFGSVFYGNNCFEKPNMLLITQIDPMLIMINILYFSMKKNDNFKILDDYFTLYTETLSNQQKPLDLEDNEIESTNLLLNYLRNYFNSNPASLERICEKTFVEYTQQDYYKLKISKVLDYLNSKVSRHPKENLKNVTSIILQFINDEIAEEFANFKGVKLVQSEEKTNIHDNTFKRKNNEENLTVNQFKSEKSNKKKAPQKPTNNKPIDKNQTTLTFGKKN